MEHIGSRRRKRHHWLRGPIAFTAKVLVPPSKGGRMAVAGAMAGSLLLTIYIMATAYYPGPLGVALGLLVASVAAIFGAIFAMLVYGLLRFLCTQAVSSIIGLMAGLVIILAVCGYPVLYSVVMLLGVIPLLAGILAAIVRVRHSYTLSGIRRVLDLGLLIVLIGIGVAGVVWYQHEGTTAHLVEWEGLGGYTSLPLDLPNPEETGPHKVNQLYYGSGTDIRRPEYGAGVSIITDSVDVTPFLPRPSQFRLGLRERYWGFDLAHSPINGRVWYPEGDGPFPLVLIVHGNHEMTDFSDSGYAYLGELLASRGYIAASIDQNFLNGSVFGGDFGGEGNVGRAWLLLQHLSTWREWQQDESSPLYGRVDMERIALVGHSRGGEAVAIAAALNQLPHYPDDANITFNFGFDLSSLVAIAPTDEFYTPAGRPVPLHDINYLLLQGAHDGDVSICMGNRQYQRAEFSGESYRFKSVAYIYQANHGQFNSDWGRRDWPAPLGKLLNIRPIMPAVEQEQIAKVYISAFLDTTLKGVSGYLPLFRNSHTGAAWLPESIITHRFQDSTFLAVSDYEEDLNPASATIPLGKQRGRNFTEWREDKLLLRTRDMDQANNVVILGWDEAERKGIPTYSIGLPPSVASWELNRNDSLMFSLADLSQGEHPFGDVTIQVETWEGAVASLNLGELEPIIPPLTIKFSKLGLLEKMLFQPAETVLQTNDLPLAAFVQANPEFNPARLKEIRFLFQHSDQGRVALDDIGFRRGR